MAQAHRSDPRILGRRTLEADHRRLAAVLRPGMSVLDVGCGTGSITAGIARAVGPAGRVTGVDRDESLLEVARTAAASLPWLTFERRDATGSLPFSSAQFDIVTAARTLQWIPEPQRAVDAMARAVKPGGQVVLLDYNHADNAWEPQPPAAFRRWYRAFLDWRSASGLDNRMGDHLAALLTTAGLSGVTVSVEDEITPHSPLWLETLEALGDRVAAAGFCSDAEINEAREQYREWSATQLRRHVLVLRAAVGVKPATA